MRKLNIIFLLFFAGVFVFSSCNSIAHKKEIQVGQNNLQNEAEALVGFIEKSSDFINTKAVPTLISASDVNENAGNYLILDIRKNADYVNGHIDGAMNTPASEVLRFLEENECAASFEKVVIACYSGQTAGYVTSALRLLGYGNVYALKYGMSSWNKKTADHWLNNISNKYAGQLELKGNPKNTKSDLPILNTGEKTTYDVLYNRASVVIKEGLTPAKIKADELFENPNKYYVVNYWALEQYAIGHVPGAVQYQPKKSFGTKTYLKTLPTDKPIVVYCYTGQHAAFVTAYLRIIGYDAKVLLYGANSFMHTKMKSEAKLGHAFNSSIIMNYDLTEGEEPSNKVVVKAAATESAPKKAAPVKKKKKEVEEEGGC